MKLQHFLGGLQGLGPVEFEKNVFVQPWEQRIFGIHVAMMALSSHLPLPKTPSGFHTIWTWADLRTGAEGLNPFDYFKYRYYEKWLGGITGYFIENGYVTEEELDTRIAELEKSRDIPLSRGGSAAIDERIEQYLIEGDSPKRDADVKPRFVVGEEIVVNNVPSADHTRLPGFLRGVAGVVDKIYDGAYVYLTDTGPDGIGPAMPVYCVAFKPSDIWGGKAEPNFTIYADLYETYVGKSVAVVAAA